MEKPHFSIKNSSPMGQTLIVLAGANSMEWLHGQICTRPGATLAPSWRSAIQEYRNE